MGRLASSILQAVKKAKEVEQAYELGDNCPPLEGLTGRMKIRLCALSDKR
jgi:hypothetical protein